MTHKIPAANTTETLIFARMFIFRCHIVHKGRISIRISEMTLMVPVTTRLRFVSTQWPGVDEIQALWMGLHWKMTDSTLAV